jgi:3D (Asp-Asp-Asp) domain-containing protein
VQGVRRHDKRTREQRKADESALFAAVCLGATVILIVVAILATSAQAVEASPEESSVVSEEYDPAWDIPATESAVCNDVFLGEFTLTAYCPGRCCCGKWASGYTATGTWATEGRTIAVDPKVIPYGSRVLLIWPDGTQHTYIAEDCGSGIQGNRIDVFFNDHQAARVFGVQSAMAYLGGEQ